MSTNKDTTKIKCFVNQSRISATNVGSKQKSLLKYVSTFISFVSTLHMSILIEVKAKRVYLTVILAIRDILYYRKFGITTSFCSKTV